MSHETDNTEQAGANSEEMRALRRDIGLGLDVKAFTRSALGREFVRRCNDMRLSALEDMADVDAENPKAIRDLQATARCAGLLLNWLGEIETAGEQAEQNFQTAG